MIDRDTTKDAQEFVRRHGLAAIVLIDLETGRIGKVWTTESGKHIARAAARGAMCAMGARSIANENVVKH